MTIIDASALIALVVPTDPHHARARAALPGLTGPWVTTWHVLVEVMYVVGRQRKWPGQKLVWQMIKDGSLVVRDAPASEAPRLEILMDTYQAIRSDMADVSLIALAEDLGLKRIFTFDTHFTHYRISGMVPFEIVP
jgi:predicted nucleic acid-binding protein